MKKRDNRRRPLGKALEMRRIDDWAVSEAGLARRLWHRLRHPAPTTRVLLSFAVLIAAGAFLLALPVSSPAGMRLPVVDALFISTSAVCVTGLSPIDVSMQLSATGQVVLLLLIQIGGLGFLTISTGLLLSLGGRSSMLNRAAVADTLTGISAGEVRVLLRNLFLSTILVEVLGAIVLAWRFLGIPGYTFGNALWQGVFHSVSAFCNAGFSTFSKAAGDPGDNLVGFTQDIPVNLAVMALIILGGIGFVVIHDVIKFIQTRGASRLSSHSKIVLSVSLVMLFGGAILFYSFERGAMFADRPWHECILPSLFQSVSSRTAGFNTVDMGALTSPTLMLVMMLMFIGGSPASCAGGVKTTTAFIVFRLAVARLLGRRNPTAFGREISADTVARTATLLLIAIAIVVTTCAVLLFLEGDQPVRHSAGGGFLDLLFESVSAFGTVGFSTGVTAELSPPAKFALVATMFVGRLGPLTVFVALAQPPRVDKIRYPEEPVMVG